MSGLAGWWWVTGLAGGALTDADEDLYVDGDAAEPAEPAGRSPPPSRRRPG